MVEALLYREHFFRVSLRRNSFTESAFCFSGARAETTQKMETTSKSQSDFPESECLFNIPRGKVPFRVRILFGIARKSDHGIILQN